MSAIVKCDFCGAVVPHTKAKHLTMHRMLSAMTFDARPDEALDACDKCCKDIISKCKEANKADGN